MSHQLVTTHSHGWLHELAVMHRLAWDFNSDPSLIDELDGDYGVVEMQDKRIAALLQRSIFGHPQAEVWEWIKERVEQIQFKHGSGQGVK